MSSRKVIITLVGTNQAKEGFKFLHRGSTDKCEGCQYVHVCSLNLEPGRIFRVVGIRDKTLYCRLSEENMRVVEVVESEVEGTVHSKQAIEGATVLFQPLDCRVEDCENSQLCFPKGLIRGDRCEVAAVIGRLRCLQSLPLVKVLLQRVPAS